MGNFRDVFKFLRNRDGYSQAELAKKLGVASSTISMYEQGKREPDFEMLESIADLFNVDMNFLLGVKKDSVPESYYLNDDTKEMAEFMYRNPEYKVLFDASRKVRKEDIEFVRQMIDRMRGTNDDT